MTLGLFQGWGIELEYMIVDATTLAVVLLLLGMTAAGAWQARRADGGAMFR